MPDQPLNWSQFGPTPSAGDNRPGNRRKIGIGAGLVAGGAIVGAVLAGTLSAGAATPSPTSSSTSGSTSSEATEGHGGGGHGLELAGTVTAVRSSSVTIKTSSGSTVTYSV